MLDELMDIAIFILLWILYRTANLRVGEALPDHWRRWRREPPIWRSGRQMRAGEIVILMAGAAFLRGYTASFGFPI